MPVNRIMEGKNRTWAACHPAKCQNFPFVFGHFPAIYIWPSSSWPSTILRGTQNGTYRIVLRLVQPLFRATVLVVVLVEFRCCCYSYRLQSAFLALAAIAILPFWHFHMDLFGIWHLAFGIWHLAFGTWHLAFGIWHLAFGIWHLNWHLDGVSCFILSATKTSASAREVEPPN